MPKIHQTFTLDVTPEKFLAACSMTELQEVSLLIDAAIRRKEREQDRSSAVAELKDADFTGESLED